MSRENEKTLEVYDKYAKIYLENSIKHDKKEPSSAKKKSLWVEDFCKKGFINLYPGAKLFEFGSADGKNATMLERLGFRVIPSDVAEDFLTAMQEYGLKPIKFNVLKDEFSDKFDGIFCWRTFVHFTKEDFELALRKIFDALNFGGRFIFNVMNLNSKSNYNKNGWQDFEDEYKMGEKRFFVHYTEDEIKKITKKIGFNLIALEKNGKEDKWICVILERPLPINQALKKYIEEEILTQYDSSAGHGISHINYVIKRSLKFAEEVSNINYNIVYTVAAYHDIGRKINNEQHEIESAKILLNDNKIKEFFNKDELKIIAEAIEDHRASSNHEPRSIYGKIVSSADRNTSINQMLGRLYKYTKSLMPEADEEEILKSACHHLRIKYSPNGYAATKMYFRDPDFEKCLLEVEKLTSDFETFKKATLKYVK